MEAAMKSKSKFVPKYTIVKDKLLREILEHYKPGDLFDSQRELMQRFNASYATIGRVLRELKAMDIISCHVGKGIFIEKLPSIHALKEVRIVVFIQSNAYVDNVSITGLYQQGLIEAQKKLPCEIIFLKKTNDEKEMLQNFKDSHADGILFIEDKMFKMIEICNKQKIPYVVIHPVVRKYEFCIDIDDAHGITSAITALIEKGRKRFLLIGRDLLGGHNSIKVDACKIGMELSDLSPENLVTYGSEREDDLLTKINKISDIMQGSDMPDAIISTDQMFLELIESVVKHKKLKIPEDVDIVSFGTHGYASEFPFPLAKIEVPYIKAANMGIKLLHKRCISTNMQSEVKLLKTEFLGLC